MPTPPTNHAPTRPPRKRRRLPFIRQRDITECGTTCLAMIFKYHGLYNVQSTLRRLGHVTGEGTDLYTLAELAEQFGFRADGYQMSLETLPQVPLPGIAHYDGNHFVVVTKVSDAHVWIADPGYGRDKLAREEFGRRWNGIFLALEPTDEVFQNPDLQDLLEAHRARRRDVRKNFYRAVFSPFRRVVGEILLASVVLQLLLLALPFFTQVIIDKVLVYQDRTLLFAILAGMIVILLTQVLLTYVRNILLIQFKVKFELDFFSRFFDHFIHLRQRYFDAYKREDFINRFQENLKVRKIFSPSILQAFIDLSFVVLAVVVFFFYNVLLAGIAVAFIVFFAVLTLYYSPRLRQLEDKIFHENLKTMGSFLDTLLGMSSVKLLGLERFKFWQWRNQYKRALNKVLETEQTHVVLQSTLRAAYFLSQIAVYWLGAYLTFGGAMTIGQYIAFVTIFTLAMTALNNASTLWFLVTELAVTYERLNDVFLEPPEEHDLTAQHATIHRPTIELRGVRFRYAENADEDVLKGLDLVIRPGEHVALVGRNGSGKSTLAKLLVRLYDHYEGAILVGGIELRRLHPRVLRQKVVLVPQDVYLFSGTIKENIRYARPTATMEEVVRAARLADLHGYVEQLYLGYNHMIGEAGANLSGGQRLKVAFARLFLSEPEVILLDEASSALDVEAERRIMQNLYARFEDRTILSIAHRLNTVRNADRILVLDAGAIVEQGTHDELLRQDGRYAVMMQNYLDF